MTSIVGFLEDIENLAYKILLWIILIPKTIIQITINPGWVLDYVRGELKQEKSPFDEYISPIVLLLVVALVPWIIFSLLPTTGVTMINSQVEEDIMEVLAEDPEVGEIAKNRFLKFEATTTYISGSSDREFVHSWYVEKIFPDAGYQEIYRDNFSSDEYFVEFTDNNTTKDVFYYMFDVPGEYYVNVDVTKLNEENIPVEQYYTYLYVDVPDEPGEPVSVSSFGGNKPEQQNFIDKVQDESTILFALALLIPPLLFALATKIATNEQISENALREHFYAQCYYFTPLGLAIWATRYAGYFYTPEIFFFKDTAYFVILLPLLLAAIWFIGVEIQFMARERKTKEWIAVIILMSCLTVLGALASVAIFFSAIQDVLRVIAIWIYPLASIALLALIAMAWLKRKRTESRKFTMGEVVLITVLFIAVAFVAGTFAIGGKTASFTPPEEINLGNDFTLLPDEGTEVIPPATEIPATAVPVSIVDTPTPEISPYYIEEFDSSPDTWSYNSSDENMVSMRIENGAAVFQISPRDNQAPWGYMINNAFTYPNVLVEAVVTNNGNNSNEISLICQYSESGWYELTFSNGGTYSFNAIDSTGTVNLLANGSAPVIKTGHATNVIGALCVGNELTLFINDTEVHTYTDTVFNFLEGKIGMGVLSPQGLPVDVQVESVTVTGP